MSKFAEPPNAFTTHADASVGIVVALPEELRTLTRQKLVQGECRQLGRYWIAYSGAGMHNAGRAAQALIEKGAQRLISWGCAAGLADGLKPGDLVMADRVVSEQSQFDTDLQWRSELKHAISANVSTQNGTLFTSAKLVSRSIDKRDIRQSSRAVALDMESAAIAEVAANNGAPFLAIRSIADPVSMDLPQAVLAGLNAEGQVDLGKLLRYLLAHPLEIVGLTKLGLNFHAAQKTLKRVAEHLGVLDDHPAPLAN